MSTPYLIKYVTYAALVLFLLLGLAAFEARVMLAIMLVVIFFCIIHTFKYNRRPVFNGVFLLLLVNVVYYVFSPKVVPGYSTWDTTGFFANIVMNLGTFFFAFYYSVKKQMNERELKWLFVAMFLVSSVRFFVTRDQIMIDRNGNMATMNMAYDFVVMLPYLYLFRHKILSSLFLIPTMYYIAYGGKRGAIVIFIASAVIILYQLYMRGRKKNLAFSIVIAIAVAVASYNILYSVYQESSLLQHRLEMTQEGDTNGRSYLFSTIWQAWLNSSSIFQLLFGYGFCASVMFAGNYAHNDWMELLGMAGLLGITIYVAFFWQLFQFSHRFSSGGWQKNALYLILFIWFTKTLFSMSYCSVGDMPMTLLLGYLVGSNQNAINIKQPIWERIN